MSMVAALFLLSTIRRLVCAAVSFVPLLSLLTSFIGTSHSGPPPLAGQQPRFTTPSADCSHPGMLNESAEDKTVDIRVFMG